MEKFLLGTFFSDDELDIVDEQGVVVPVFFPKFRGGDVVFVTDGVDQLIGEFFRGNIQNLGVFVVFQDKMGDGVHQVGLSQPHAPVDKQGIVHLSR